MEDKIINLPERFSNVNGCFRLAGAVIAQCFSIKYKKETRKIRIDFANKSPLIQKFSDCADIDETKIKQKIIQFNN